MQKKIAVERIRVEEEIRKEQEKADDEIKEAKTEAKAALEAQELQLKTASAKQRTLEGDIERGKQVLGKWELLQALCGQWNDDVRNIRIRGRLDLSGTERWRERWILETGISMKLDRKVERALLSPTLEVNFIGHKYFAPREITVPNHELVWEQTDLSFDVQYPTGAGSWKLALQGVRLPNSGSWWEAPVVKAFLLGTTDPASQLHIFCDRAYLLEIIVEFLADLQLVGCCKGGRSIRLNPGGCNPHTPILAETCPDLARLDKEAEVSSYLSFARASQLI